MPVFVVFERKSYVYYDALTKNIHRIFMFNFIKNALGSIYNQFTSKVRSLFNASSVDNETLAELEKILISADTGIETTRILIKELKQEMAAGKITKGQELEVALSGKLKALLKQKPYNPVATVYLLVGINGSGKTTFASKLATHFYAQGKKVLFVAGDTFRAAATHQLDVWAKRIGIDIVIGKENQDPASVIFTGCEEFKAKNYDILIIDTAGRLQTKTNLMKELEKIRRIIDKQLPGKTISTLLTIDSMLGQNSLEQAKIFHESTHLDGIILTKMDGTGKGGIVFSISKSLQVPIAYISYGEQPDQMRAFNADEYVDNLLNG